MLQLIFVALSTELLCYACGHAAIGDDHRMKAEALHAQLFAAAVALQELFGSRAKLCFLWISD